MKYFSISIIALLLLIGCTTKQNKNLIAYSVSHNTTEDGPRLNLKMTFPADTAGTTTLLYQDNAWGQDSLHNALKDLKLVQKGSIRVNRDSGWVVIEHDKAEKLLEFEYSIQQDSDSIITTDKVYRPVVQENYFQAFGHNLFMLPKHMVNEEDATFDISIDWNGLREDFKIQNSFGNQQRQQYIPAVSQEEFHTAMYVGGDFRIYNLEIEGNKVALAIRDQWEVFNDSTMINLLQETITAQRNFWKDHSQDYFSVTMIPTFEQFGSSFQGTGLTNSFALAASNNERLEVEGLVYLLNHELQHNWTGLIIKNDNEEEQYWFSEGFTDYYTIQNISRNRIYGLEGNFFVEEFNRMIRNLFANPEREAPNSEINYENFWSSYDFTKLPYQRGALFAFYLDMMIMKDSDGSQRLDNLMLKFKNNPEQKIDHDYFLESANTFLSEDLTPIFKTNIIEGRLPDLATYFDEFGLDYSASATLFELGYETTDDRRTVIAVTPGSNAEKAGLKIGDYFRSYSLQYDRPDIEANFVIERNGEQVPISFYPARQADIPQLEVTENNMQRLRFE